MLAGLNAFYGQIGGSRQGPQSLPQPEQTVILFRPTDRFCRFTASFVQLGVGRDRL